MKSRRSEAIVRALKQALQNSTNDEGVPFDTIYSLIDNNVKKKCSKVEIKMLLTKGEFPEGKACELENGNFQFTVSKFEAVAADDSDSQGKSVSGDFNTDVSKPVKNKYLQMRTPSLLREKSDRKRIQKVVFDPSDLEPKRKKLIVKKSPTELDRKETPATPCKVCNEMLNSTELDGALGGVSACEDCGCKVHTSCTTIGAMRSSQWRCEDCKLCSICRGKRSPRGEPLIQCAVCSESYHMKCANVKKVKPTWLCSTCKRIFPGDGDTKDDSDSSRSTSPPSVSSPEPKQKPSTRRHSRESIKKEPKKEVDETEEDEKIPDCSEWTPEQVHAYFMLFVPSQDAQVFLDQEIDGRILLLLNRSDVLTRFNLKLGPALKVYSLVKRLQERSSDIKLCWP